MKQEELHHTVAPTQGVGPGVAAEIDQGVEEEPGIDVLSELAPRFGCKELSNQIFLFGFGERDRVAELHRDRSNARLEECDGLGVVLRTGARIVRAAASTALTTRPAA